MSFGKILALVAAAGLTAACNSERHDATVNQAVMARLSEQPELGRQAVQVETKNGHVTLSGQVLNEDQRQMAEREAQGVSGVKTVTNNLEVSVSSPPPEAAPPSPLPPPSETPTAPPPDTPSAAPSGGSEDDSGTKE